MDKEVKDREYSEQGPDEEMPPDTKELAYSTNVVVDLEQEFANSINVDVNDVDQETSLKLRGDAIGDTLYSQSFVLRTLLKLSDLVWNEQIEEDLCFLWDMTLEKGVCEYLFEINCPSIVCDAISKYNEERFIEIVIGIMANIICADCDKSIRTEEINILLQEFDTNDSLILIQLMRFISACAHTSTKVLFMTENIMNKICFVLQNSANRDLLLKALEATAKITVEFKLPEEFVNIELYNSVITAYSTITSDNSDNVHLDYDEQKMSLRYMLEFVINICSYIDHFKNHQLFLGIRENFHIFFVEILKILEYFNQKQNLLPVSEDFIFLVSASRYIFITLNVDYSSQLFISLTKILYNILLIREDVPDLFESLSELVIFIISRGSADKLGRDLKHISKHKFKNIVDVLIKNYEYMYDIDWHEILQQIKR